MEYKNNEITTKDEELSKVKIGKEYIFINGELPVSKLKGDLFKTLYNKEIE